MSSNLIKRKWQKDEIDLLKKEFKNGTQIKIIANKLGKTETAVNKFLTRCGIRPRYRNNRINYRYKSNIINYQSNIIKKQPSNNNSAKWVNLFNNIVDFKEVIKYLKSKNYKISNIISENIKLIYPNSQYMLNGQPVSKMKLLILANKLREEENKNAFKLDCII